MKAKQIILLSILLFCAFLCVYSNPTPELKHIILQGKSTSSGGITRLPSNYPTIEAYSINSNLEIMFNHDVGMVTVIVTNNEGYVVYQDDVVTGNGVKKIIDLSEFSTGKYKLALTNSGNMFLQGEFVI